MCTTALHVASRSSRVRGRFGGSSDWKDGPGTDIGLSRAFQYAGAQTVLASLWKVPDQSTSVLMQHFYRHLEAGENKSSALRAAQLYLISGPMRGGDGPDAEEIDASHPYFWAAFQLNGDWR